MKLSGGDLPPLGQRLELKAREIGEVAARAVERCTWIRLLLDVQELFVDAIDAGEQPAEIDHALAKLSVRLRADLRSVLDVKEPVAIAVPLHVFHRIAPAHRKVAGVELQSDHTRVGSFDEHFIRNLTVLRDEIIGFIVEAYPDISRARDASGLVQPIGPAAIVVDRGISRQAGEDDVLVTERIRVVELARE